MLSRTSSDVSTRLRRAKSASSVTKRRNVPSMPQKVDPVVARYHAMTAAQVAMGRARERSSADLRRSAELSRTGSTASKAATSHTSKPHSISFSKAALRRQRSTTGGLKPKGSSRSDGYRMGSQSEECDITATPQVEGHEYISHGYGSIPSSYRKLRKAKSMLAPRMGSTRRSERAPSADDTPPAHVEPRPAVGVTLRRSLSFLKPNRFYIPKHDQSQSQPQDAAIQLARDQFMHDLEQQRLKSRPSFLFAPKLRRQQKPFRKSVRSSRTLDGAESVSTFTRSVAEDQPGTKFDVRARTVSRSIRNTFKRVFGRSGIDQSLIPPQELDASRPHFGDYVGEASNDAETDNTGFLSEAGTLSISRDSVPNRKSSIDDPHSVSGSVGTMRSSGSLFNNRSRVTSWTNSTATNTVSTRDAAEKKRLSIIQEHGPPHQPSSSVGRHNASAYAAFGKPMRVPPDDSNLKSPVLDPQRIYSALIRRIDESSPEREEDEEEIQIFAARRTVTEHTRGVIPSVRRVSSVTSLRSGEASRSTRISGLLSQLSRKPDNSGSEIEMTPQETADRNELARKRSSKHALQDVQSSFFPFSSETKPQTPSPFKLALVASRLGTQSSSDDDSKSIVVSRPGPNDRTTGTESVYSRSTSGRTPVLGESEYYESNSDVEGETGTATVQASRRTHYGPLPGSGDEGSPPKPKSSGEWKSWMNSQVASIDRQDSRSRRYMAAYRPSYAHHRESAQIDGDDTAIGNSRASHSTFGKPHITEPETPTSRRRPSMMNERFPLLDLKEVPRKSIQSQQSHQSRRKLSNDERLISGTQPHSNSYTIRPQGSTSSLRSTTSAMRPPELLSPKARVAGPLVSPQSSVTIRSQFGRIVDANDSPASAERSKSQLSGRSPPLSFNKENKPPALAKVSSGDGEEVVKDQPEDVRGLSSKGMVSNFLRSRRRNTRTAETGSGEPAFL